jgi:hypothetical protein
MVGGRDLVAGEEGLSVDLALQAGLDVVRAEARVRRRKVDFQVGEPVAVHVPDAGAEASAAREDGETVACNREDDRCEDLEGR